MVTGSLKQQLYFGAAVFSKLLRRQVKKEEKTKTLNYEYLWKFQINSTKSDFIQSHVEHLHDITLMNKGQGSDLHLCNYKPFNKKLKIDKAAHYKSFTDRKSFNKGWYQKREAHNMAVRSYSEKLCKGGQLLVRRCK